MESSAPLTAKEPSSIAEKAESLPLNAPMGVLLAATMYTLLPMCLEEVKSLVLTYLSITNRIKGDLTKY